MDPYKHLVTEHEEMHQIISERSGGLCELCGSSYMVQRHHIVGGRGKRKYHENQYSMIDLCHHHHYGKRGVHESDGSLDRKLKIRLQEKYKELGFNEEQIRELMGGKITVERESKGIGPRGSKSIFRW